MTEHVDCRFCRDLAPEELIADTEAHLAIASYGALVEGWSLTLPRRHVLSTADLTNDEWDELRRFTDRIVAQVRDRYGVDPVMFEHGPVSNGRPAGCGVDHAHLHVVPIALDLRTAIAAIDDPATVVWTPTTGRPQRDGRQDYIWIKDATGIWIWHSTGIGSQVVRRAIAKELGEESWDWKQDLRTGIVHKSAARLRPAAWDLLAS